MERKRRRCWRRVGEEKDVDRKRKGKEKEEVREGVDIKKWEKKGLKEREGEGWWLRGGEEGCREEMGEEKNENEMEK